MKIVLWSSKTKTSVSETEKIFRFPSEARLTRWQKIVPSKTFRFFFLVMSCVFILKNFFDFDFNVVLLRKLEFVRMLLRRHDLTLVLVFYLFNFSLFTVTFTIELWLVSVWAILRLTFCSNFPQILVFNFLDQKISISKIQKVFNVYKVSSKNNQMVQIFFWVLPLFQYDVRFRI